VHHFAIVNYLQGPPNKLINTNIDIINMSSNKALYGIITNRYLPSDFFKQYYQLPLKQRILGLPKKLMFYAVTKFQLGIPILIISVTALFVSIPQIVYIIHHKKSATEWLGRQGINQSQFVSMYYPFALQKNLNPQATYNSITAMWSTDPLSEYVILPKRSWEVLSNPSQVMYKFKADIEGIPNPNNIK
jgi:hypothetical protein